MRIRKVYKVSKHRFVRAYKRSVPIALRLPLLEDFLNAESEEDLRVAHDKLVQGRMDLEDMYKSILLGKFPRKKKKRLKQLIQNAYNAYGFIPAIAKQIKSNK